MVLITEPIKIKLELTSQEIEYIRDELERAPHTIYEFMDYDKIIKKLNEALKKLED